LLTSFGHVHNKKKGKVLHAIDHWWIMGWLCEIGWILTIQYDTLGSYWAGFGFWTGAFVCFGFSALRLNAFRGWFNLWYGAYGETMVWHTQPPNQVLDCVPGQRISQRCVGRHHDDGGGARPHCALQQQH